MKCVRNAELVLLFVDLLDRRPTRKLREIACFHTDSGAARHSQPAAERAGGGRKVPDDFRCEEFGAGSPTGHAGPRRGRSPVVAPHLMDSASMRMSAFLRRTG